MSLALGALLQGDSVLAHSNAYNQGYWDARNAYMNGDNFDDHCSFDHSDTYCFDYKLGYRVGWTRRNCFIKWRNE